MDKALGSPSSLDSSVGTNGNPPKDDPLDGTGGAEFPPQFKDEKDAQVTHKDSHDPSKTHDATSKRMLYEGVNMTDWEKLKCDIRKCSEYIKRMKDQNVVVSTRDQWPAMLKHLKEIASLERWEDDIICLDGPEWDEDLKNE